MKRSLIRKLGLALLAIITPCFAWAEEEVEDVVYTWTGKTSAALTNSIDLTKYEKVSVQIVFKSLGTYDNISNNDVALRIGSAKDVADGFGIKYKKGGGWGTYFFVGGTTSGNIPTVGSTTNLTYNFTADVSEDGKTWNNISTITWTGSGGGTTSGSFTPTASQSLETSTLGYVTVNASMPDEVTITITATPKPERVTYVRTIEDSEVDWSAEAAWAKDTDNTATVAVPVDDNNATLTVNKASTITMNAPSTIHALTIGGTAKATFAGDNALNVDTTTINTNMDVSAITANLGDVTIAEGVTLTIGEKTTWTSLTNNGTYNLVVNESATISATILNGANTVTFADNVTLTIKLANHFAPYDATKFDVPVKFVSSSGTSVDEETLSNDGKVFTPLWTRNGVRYSYAFVGTNGETDASEVATWEISTGVSSTSPSGEKSPMTSGSNMWEPALFDGNIIGNNIETIDGYKNISMSGLEGWNLKLAAMHGVNLTIKSLVKIQIGAAGQSYINVDESSRVKIFEDGNTSNLTMKENNLILNVASKEGLIFNCNQAGDPIAIEYNLGTNGSVVHNGTLSDKASATIASYTLDLGEGEDTETVTRTLVSFTRSDKVFSVNTPTFSEENIDANRVTAVSELTELGDYYVEQTDTGVIVTYVKRTTEAPVVNTASANDTEYATIADALKVAGVTEVTVIAATNEAVTLPEGVTLKVEEGVEFTGTVADGYGTSLNPDENGTYTCPVYQATITVGTKTTGYTTLQAAVNAANDGETIVVTDKTEWIDTIVLDDATKAITIDLNSQICYPSTATVIHVKNGTLTLTNGMIVASGIAVQLGIKNGSTTSTLIVDATCSLSSWTYAMVGEEYLTDGDNVVLMYGNATLETAGTLTTYSTEYAAIQGSGGDLTANTTIKITGGTVASENNHAIYHPQPGTVTITGGTISGKTGIEMRAGTLDMQGGTVTATGTYVAPDANNSGSTAEGAAIILSQHTTEEDITLKIAKGVNLSVTDTNAKKILVVNTTSKAPVTYDVSIAAGVVTEADIDLKIDTLEVTTTTDDGSITLTEKTVPTKTEGGTTLSEGAQTVITTAAAGKNVTSVVVAKTKNETKVNEALEIFSDIVDVNEEGKATVDWDFGISDIKVNRKATTNAVESVTVTVKVTKGDADQSVAGYAAGTKVVVTVGGTDYKADLGTNGTATVTIAIKNITGELSVKATK